MTNCAVMGIDPSLVGLAVAFKVPGVPIGQSRFTSKPADGVHARLARFQGLTDSVMALVTAQRPRLVLIEGYSFNSKNGMPIDRIEMGGILRWRIAETGARIVEVPPTTLKKFACGRGNADKSEMVSAMSHRFDRIFKNDDEADAYALLHLALCMTAQASADTKPQREVVEALLAKERAARSEAA